MLKRNATGVVTDAELRRRRWQMIRRLASEYGLAVRAWLEPARRKLRQQSLPVVDHEFLDSFRLDIDGKSARYAKLLHDLPAGLSEWAVHPALGDAQSQMI